MAGEKKNTGAAARNAAIKRLVTHHTDQFDSFLKEERRNRGLTPVPTSSGMTPEKMREQLKKAEERAAKLREQLGVTA